MLPRRIFEEYGIGWTQLHEQGAKLYPLSIPDSIDMMKDGRLDIDVYHGEEPAFKYNDILSTTKLKFLPVDEKILEKLAKEMGGEVTEFSETAAATGIGLAYAMRLAKKYRIIGIWLITAMPTEIHEEANIKPFQCDVSNFEDCLKLARYAASLGEIHGFVHCAAINPTPAPSVEEMEPEFWKRILDVNLTSSFYLAKAVIPLTANGGAYVFVSSTAGRNGFSLAGGAPGHAKTAYATSKAGIIAFTKGLAKELASRNISVNCMAAGPIDTRMLPNREETARRVPLGRIGLPEECAAAVEFLLKEAIYTTGCTLDVCGGQYMN